MSEAVHLHNVSVELGGREIIRPMTVHIPEACVTSIIGANGAGKTTLVKAILGLTPYSGEILFNKPRPQMRLGYVPQRLETPGDLPLSVLDFISLTAGRRPLFLGTSSKMRIEAAAALELTGMSHIENRPVSALSGGELQRVLLAAAVLRRCEILFLDEPAAGMDIAGEKRLHDVLKSLIEKYRTAVVMVTHDLAAVHSLSQHVICMGAVVCEGPAASTLTQETLAKVFEDSAWYAHGHSHSHGAPHDRHI